MAGDDARPSLTSVITIVIVIILPLLLPQVSTASSDRLGLSHTTSAAPDPFLLKLRAEVDRDRLLFVAQNSAMHRQVSQLTSQVSQLAAQVSAIQNQLSAGGGGGGSGGGGGVDDVIGGGSINSQQPATPGHSSSGKSGGQGTSVHGSCPSGCKVSSDLNRVQVVVQNTRTMVVQAVKDLQDHLVDMTSDLQKRTQRLDRADSGIHDTLTKHDALLDSLAQKVDHMDAVFRPGHFVSSSSSAVSSSPSNSTPKPTVPPPAVYGSSPVAWTQSNALVSLDGLKRQVSDLKDEQRRFIDSQNLRVSQMEREVSQLQNDNSALMNSMNSLEKDVDSTSQRLLLAETEASDASRNLNQGLSEVNVTLSAIGDTLHLLQTKDTEHVTTMQHLTNQQASLSARAAGNANMISSLSSDLSRVDHRLSVMSGVVHSQVQDLQALNRTLNVFRTSSASTASPLLPQSSSSPWTTQSPVSARTPRPSAAQYATSTAPAASSQSVSTPDSWASSPQLAHAQSTKTAALTVPVHAVHTRSPTSVPIPTQFPTPKAFGTKFPVPTKTSTVSGQWSQQGSNAARPAKTARVTAPTSPVPTAMPTRGSPTAVPFPTPGKPARPVSSQSPIIAVPTRQPAGGGAPTPHLVTPTPALLIPPSPSTSVKHNPNMVVPTRKVTGSMNQHSSFAVPSPKPSIQVFGTPSSAMAVPTRKPSGQNSVTQRPNMVVPTRKPFSRTPQPAFPTPSPLFPIPSRPAVLRSSQTPPFLAKPTPRPSRFSQSGGGNADIKVPPSPSSRHVPMIFTPTRKPSLTTKLVFVTPAVPTPWGA